MITINQLRDANRLNESLIKLKLILTGLEKSGGEGDKVGLVNVFNNKVHEHNYATTLHYFNSIEDELTSIGIELIKREIASIENDLSEYIIKE